MTLDSDGQLYVAATRLGVQICDQRRGRVVVIIASRSCGFALSNVVFGGFPDTNTLYATSGDEVFRRVVRSKGVFRLDHCLRFPKPRLSR